MVGIITIIEIVIKISWIQQWRIESDIYFIYFLLSLIDFFFLLGEQLQAPPPGKLSPEREGFFNSDADQKVQGPEVEMVGIFCPFSLLFSQVLFYLLFPFTFYLKISFPFLLGI
jgi:hypothetical protein